jgi:5-methylcytosine-specific restriction endonuclease McrA
VDHVVPRSRGGSDSWLNTVASCAEDNHRKANRTPEQAEMPLLREPFAPSPADAMLLSLRTGERFELPEWLAGVRPAA